MAEYEERGGLGGTGFHPTTTASNMVQDFAIRSDGTLVLCCNGLAWFVPADQLTRLRSTLRVGRSGE